ncbi:endonuclease domain-containing 1 protein [Plakobranchus ocellatus]|uniref:Endonuclease domain-containing 1 protein n=1 Tax=Plakobranchus ocellatus TaxID=259542 RepID=A0AAV4BGL3_9GAST|nr:endonuclease domain-containing 1 protein [Plakobranchus ocellatus]
MWPGTLLSWDVIVAVNQRCRANKPATEAGDFAEGCWRNHVYGERLPVGVSNKQMRTYFICQRFAPTGRAGMTFGYKHTYFTTLYDINLRAPVMSLVKLTSLGDDIWPETDYFIEHGLVETDAKMMWIFQKPRKGMLTLADLDRCYDEQGCDLGLRQVLPQDYHNYFPETDHYTPTHLLWPDLMPSDPSHRLSTFTLTNMAPMLISLFKEWHAMVLKIRQFALEQCHIPYNFDLDIKHPGQFSSHRTHKAALYIASGVLPNLNPVVTTGRDVHVPFMFWMSGCCVQHYAPSASTDHGNNSSSSDNNNGDDKNNSKNKNNEVYMNWEDDTSHTGSKTNVSAFAVYIQNTKGSHVIAAPVLQLEMLLQDMYKMGQNLDDVTLFPGHDSVCSALKHDVSPWFQL